MNEQKPIPVEPTEAMLATLREALPLGHEYLRAVYAALIDAAPPQAGHDDLRRFYNVTTDAELIAAQARHIEKLQAKLPAVRDEQPRRVREG